MLTTQGIKSNLTMHWFIYSCMTMKDLHAIWWKYKPLLKLDTSIHWNDEQVELHLIHYTNLTLPRRTSSCMQRLFTIMLWADHTPQAPKPSSFHLLWQAANGWWVSGWSICSLAYWSDFEKSVRVRINTEMTTAPTLAIFIHEGLCREHVTLLF